MICLAKLVNRLLQNGFLEKIYSHEFIYKTFANLYIFLYTASAISCYNCEVANAIACNTTQKKTPCSLGEDTCITVTYSDTFYNNEQQEIQRNYLLKSCVPRDYSCPWMCRSLEETGHTNCKVSEFVILQFRLYKFNFNAQNHEQKPL